MFTKHLLDSLQRTDEGIHQDLLSIAYADWQAAHDWSYADMLKNAAKKYGELVEFAILIGKYNQQVCNGGHFQYWDNGYASANTGGCLANHSDTILHERLIDLFKTYKFNKLKFGSAVYAGLISFLRSAEKPGDCYNCHGVGGWDEIDEDGEEYFDECGSCTGSGDDDDNIEDTSHLDSAYYDVYEEWEPGMEKFFLEAFETEQKALQS